ncbi:hypothetical protein DVR12_00900 [Chitinophaga silvatica]|uniref:Uncharacterized protein n=1 Tax=Chitinophaga silvatica TaxID=2282649 RepID=A0A3E1YG71_9BACT|nr:hypothetical protein [Chitinophaga silvatica]RFS26379.1 hypothetical protein DVR12_00900 [Chitinophaga silvatica]
MKLLLTALTLFSLTTKAPATVNPPVKERTTTVATRQSSFPRNVNWIIAYFPGLPMVSLNWPGTTYPGIGPIQVIFQGTTYTVDPSNVSYLLMPGITISANTNYTMKIAGVNYYFRWDGSSGQCTITGHD